VRFLSSPIKLSASTSQAPQGACENWQPCLFLDLVVHQDARYDIINLRIEVNKRLPEADKSYKKMTALFCIMVKSAVGFSDVFYCVRYRRLQ